MADLEHLSLFAEWDTSEQGHFVRNFPARGERAPEAAVLELLTSEGWKLMSITPTYEQRTQGAQSHLLNLEREPVEARSALSSRTLRIVTQGAGVRTVRARPPTAVGQGVEIVPGLSIKFLGVTRLKSGSPDLSLLGQQHFTFERSALFTGLISITSAGVMDTDTLGDLFCQFLSRSIDGAYHDDVHAAERLVLRDAGLIVGMPFGSAQLEPNVPLRNSRFEYLIFTGEALLGKAAQLLIRFPFTIAPA